MSTITIGVDLAKSLFSVCTVDANGHVLRRQDLGREAVSIPEQSRGITLGIHTEQHIGAQHMVPVWIR